MKSYRNEIFKFVKDKYKVEPEFLWQKFPSYAVLRNKENKKWFGVLMSIPKSKLGLGGSEEIEVMNIKCYPEGIFQLLDEGNGFLAGYHMNKKYWISVLLDGLVDLERVKTLLQTSYDIVASK